MLGDLLQYSILLCPNLGQDKKKANIWGKSKWMKTIVGQVSIFLKMPNLVFTKGFCLIQILAIFYFIFVDMDVGYPFIFIRLVLLVLIFINMKTIGYPYVIRTNQL
jgi:hypothetical protein